MKIFSIQPGPAMALLAAALMIALTAPSALAAPSETTALAPDGQPDGRIRALGEDISPYVGDDIYNDTGAGQTRKGLSYPGNTVTFRILVQNDSPASSERFVLSRSGAATDDYTITYFHADTDITAGMIAGTYRTPLLGPGATFSITARVRVRANAGQDARVTRRITITSINREPAYLDVVRFKVDQQCVCP